MATFVSYAQNFEDVILHRVLGDIAGGCYVDVGAQHPLRDSVTRAFYERGWRGVNIEPVPMWAGLLDVDRPEDVNLRVVVGASEGEVAFYEVHASGLSTTDANVASRHALDGFEVTMRAMPMVTLDKVFEQYARGDVHFLKIDVEGGEVEVLKGLSLDRHRPWVIVVEATLPNTQVDSSAEWESLICDAGYSMVYHDGLNRFYLANEHGRLRVRFAHPPNFFDNFVRHSDWERAEQARHLAEEGGVLQERIETLEASLSQSQALQDDLEADLIEASQRFDGVNAALDAVSAESAERARIISKFASEKMSVDVYVRRMERAEADLQAMLSSRSWRVTRPLRWVSERLRIRRGHNQPASPVVVPSANAPAPQAPAASRWRPGMPHVPDQQRLLALASRGSAAPVAREESAPAPAPARSHVGSSDGRLDALLGELRALSYPPTSLPPRLDRLPGSSVLKIPALRIYERLFRKQALINEKMAEVLRILRDSQRTP